VQLTSENDTADGGGRSVYQTAVFETATLAGSRGNYLRQKTESAGPRQGDFDGQPWLGVAGRYLTAVNRDRTAGDG
jgi:hypothetical protein